MCLEGKAGGQGPGVLGPVGVFRVEVTWISVTVVEVLRMAMS